jgi:hypothetical protein
MKELKKAKKIQKISNLVGCMKRFQAKRIELLLLVVQIVTIILCIMNLLIIPSEVLNNSLKALRIVIIIFFGICLICLIYNQILRKRKILTMGCFYCISFYGSILSLILSIVNFIFILISCILVVNNIKKQEKVIEHKSILTIDIFSLITDLALIFLWYTEFLIIYAKTNESIKEYVESNIRFFQSQNQKVVNVELNDEGISDNRKSNDLYNKMDSDIISSHKVEINEKESIDKNKNKVSDESNDTNKQSNE